jgi:hypothetical protein
MFLSPAGRILRFAQDDKQSARINPSPYQFPVLNGLLPIVGFAPRIFFHRNRPATVAAGESPGVFVTTR